tara:strand:- start:1387 stop:1575 length:189 start_codon:yes stop_codon:yes gene_type:complete
MHIGDLVEIKTNKGKAYKHYHGIVIEELANNKVSVSFVVDEQIFINQVNKSDLTLLSEHKKH